MQNLVVPQNLVIHSKNNGTITFIIVPENSNNPWKLKAQQVIRFADIETGFQDEVSLDFHFQQSAGRQVSKILGFTMYLFL